MGRSRNGGRDKLSKRKRKTRHLRRKSYVKLPKRVHTGGVGSAPSTTRSMSLMELERALGDCLSQGRTTRQQWLLLVKREKELERALRDCQEENESLQEELRRIRNDNHESQ